MATGERIRHFRKLHGMTMEYLGEKLGYPQKSAHVRMSQYENGVRGPKKELIDQLAEIFEVSPQSLTVPDIDSYEGLMHTFFALEDMYGIHVDYADGDLSLKLEKERGQAYVTLFRMLYEWHEQRARFESGEITEEEYNQWRYNYPESTVKKNNK
ncbi:helix-turn-helix transcriptional regulator [Paenibacillus polygoni]|uniref:Helix-turn-helix transcriptional regulator n=1 Tax=Paenibacillus polygoni TaxID=3050112 RepID=A0ABY8X2I4_9BACL|nr:helix-turn-helix transcriptional regulator [Paenibacillus polygoni]WIV19727.1 helix-turn-helix transcriptional regulator [Paenibacillus polygoni]